MSNHIHVFRELRECDEEFCHSLFFASACYAVWLTNWLGRKLNYALGILLKMLLKSWTDAN